MRYWRYALAGMLICGASLVAIDWSLYHLIRTGTCASGGPYVSARPCPPGTGGQIMAMIGGIFGGLIGAGVFAARKPGNRRPSPIPLPLALWSLLFCTLAAAAIVGAYGPAADDRADSRTAAVILGVIFIPMGLIPLPFALGSRKSRFRMTTSATLNTGPGSASADPREQMRQALAIANRTSAVSKQRSAEDAAAKIEKLGVLRDKGLITPEEFDAKKRELLDEI